MLECICLLCDGKIFFLFPVVNIVGYKNIISVNIKPVTNLLLKNFKTRF